MNWSTRKGNRMKRLDTLLFKMMTLSSTMQGAFLLLGCIGLYSVFSRDSRSQISEEVDRVIIPILSEISRNEIIKNNAANELLFLQVQTQLRLKSISLADSKTIGHSESGPYCREYPTHLLCDHGDGLYYFMYAVETDKENFKTLILTKESAHLGFQPIVDKILIVAFVAALMTLGLNFFLLLSTRKVITKDVSKLIAAFASKTNETSPFALKETEYLHSEFRILLAAVEQSTKAAKDVERDIAISKMTQMLAHDVRKPFSMLKIGLNLLQSSANDSKALKSNLALLVSEVERATRSVDGILSDVMEIGSPSTHLILEAVAPESLIEWSLAELFRVYPQAKISITYDLQHSAMVDVHVQKITRVFSNILGNALQAMDFTGSLWFKTRDLGDSVEFCVGNSGSIIPPESLPKLFEAFFTSGKKGGTGLGLAIAQKVVQAHGGKIWCESKTTKEHSDGLVEFFFTLPESRGVPLKTTASLPTHSDQVTSIIRTFNANIPQKPEDETHHQTSSIQQALTKLLKTITNPLGILIVDDEAIYRNGLASWIDGCLELSASCIVFHASSVKEALDTLGKEMIHLVITDIDLGPNCLDGFSLVEKIREIPDFRGLVFVHSNRIVPHDHKKSNDLGADGFVAKPMVKDQFLRLVLQALYQVNSNLGGLKPSIHSPKPQGQPHAEAMIGTPSQSLDNNSCETGPFSQEKGPLGQVPLLMESTKSPETPHSIAERCPSAEHVSLPEILLVEDDIFIREAWSKILEKAAKPIVVKDFKSLKKYLITDPHLPTRLSLVITDMYLEDKEGDGLDVAKLLKSLNPQVPVVLSSDGIFRKETSHGLIDAIIPKEPAPLNAIFEKLRD